MNGLTTWKRFPQMRTALLTIPIAILAVVSGCGSAKSTLESVVVRDTIVVTKEKVLHDTLTIQKDTILYQDRVRVEIKYLAGEKIMVRAECPADTIKVETIRIVNQPIQKKGVGWESLAGWVIAVLCLMVFVRTLVQKYI